MDNYAYQPDENNERPFAITRKFLNFDHLYHDKQPSQYKIDKAHSLEERRIPFIPVIHIKTKLLQILKKCYLEINYR